MHTADHISLSEIEYISEKIISYHRTKLVYHLDTQKQKHK